MLRTALRNLRRHKLRFALPALAVLLGVACVSGSLLYSGAVRSAMTESWTASRPDVSVEVRPAESAGPPGTGSDGPRIDEKLRQRLARLPGASAARGTLEGGAFLVGPDGQLVGSRAHAAGAAYVPGRGGADPRYPLAVGRGPRDAGEIAVDAASARRTGYHVGDRVRVVVAGKVHRVRLVGVFTAHDPRLTAGGTLTAFDRATAAGHFAPAPGRYSSVTLTARSGTPPTELADSVRRQLPRGLETVTRTELDAEAAESPDSRKLSQLLLGFAGIALIVSTFLVGNTFTMLGAARAREYALLRAVGATRRYVQRLVLTEAVLVGAVASVAGYLLGIGVAHALGGFFDAAAGGVEASVRPGLLEPTPLLAAFGVGIGVTALAAHLPARRAASVPPVAALRTAEPPAPASLRRRQLLGAGVTALGGLTLKAAAGSPDPMGLLLPAVPLLLMGVALLTPLLATGVTRVLRAPLRWLAGVRGTLALANVRRNPRRTAATTTALTVGLSLVAAVTVAVASLGAMARDEAERDMPTELRITAVDFGEIGDDVAPRVARLPDARAVTPVTGTAIETGGDGHGDGGGDGGEGGGEVLSAVAVDADAVPRIPALHVRSGSLERLGAGGVAVTREAAREHGWHVGDRITGRFADGRGRVDRRVVAVYDGPEALTPALLPTDALPARSGTEAREAAPVESVLVTPRQGRADGLKREIRHTLDNPALLVQDRADVGREAADGFSSLLRTMYAMLSVTVLIGALGVANTMGMAVHERVRETGLLRAVGLDRGGVRAVLVLESLVISLLGAALGLVTGGVVGAAVVGGQEGAVLTVPWGTMLLLFAGSAALGVVASLIPSHRAAAVPLRAAIGADGE